MKDLTNVVFTCPFCGTSTVVAINLDDYEEWQDGKPVQSAFPYLNASEREVVKTGMCYSCQTLIFGE